MLNRLGSVRYFLSVVDEGSVRKAAANCNISQPALTRHVQSLEEELGVALFERTSRGMVLTPFGAIVHHHAKQIQSSCEDMIREIQETVDGEKGTLRISAGPGWSFSIVPEVISQLQRLSPGVRIECSSDLIADSLSDLRAGNVDIVINRLDTMTESDIELVHEPLLTIKHYIFAGRDHPLRKQKHVGVESLLPYPWLSFLNSVEARQAVKALFENVGVRPPEPTVVTNSYQTCLNLLSRGEYLMVLPSTLASFADDRGIATLPIEEPIGEFAAGLIYRPSALRLTYFKRFRAILEESVKKIQEI